MCRKVESEPKHEVATTEREFKFRKRIVFSVLGSLLTVLLYSRVFVASSIRRLRKFASVFETMFSTRFSLGF